MIRKIQITSVLMAVLLFFSFGQPVGAKKKKVTANLKKIGYKIGNIAPEFTLKNIEGEEFFLKECRGKVVYMVFWSLG